MMFGDHPRGYHGYSRAADTPTSSLGATTTASTVMTHSPYTTPVLYPRDSSYYCSTTTCLSPAASPYNCENYELPMDTGSEPPLYTPQVTDYNIQQDTMQDGSTRTSNAYNGDEVPSGSSDTGGEHNNTTPDESSGNGHHPLGSVPPAYSFYNNSPDAGGRPSYRGRINYAMPVVAPEGAHHTLLAGQVEFIQPPKIDPIDHPTPAFPCHRLFLGQIRFESTSADLRWLIRYLTGVTCPKVEPRGIGCFLAYCRTYDELLMVKSLHKRILFDVNGVWFARTPAQTEVLKHYVENHLRVYRRSRLPKDAMVVEEEKVPRPQAPSYTQAMMNNEEQSMYSPIHSPMAASD